MLSHLVTRLDRSNYTPMILCLDDKGELAADLEDLDIPVVAYGRKPGQDVGLFFRLARFFKTNHVDLVHTHNIGALFYGNLAAKMTGTPVVHTQHDPQLTYSLKRKTKVLLSSLGTKKIVAVSEDIALLYRKSFKIPENRLTVICNGIDINIKSDQAAVNSLQSQCRIQPGDFVIGTVARFAEVKDLSTLIDAFSIIVQQQKNAHLVLAGDGPLTNSLKEQARNCVAKDKIHFLGYRNDVFNVLALFDVFVNCSLSEGLSITILEAMASKLPVIATAVGGNVELIQDGNNGRLVPVRNPKKLAQALLDLIADPLLCADMGKINRSRIEQQYSLSNMVRQYENIYASVLGKN